MCIRYILSSEYTYKTYRGHFLWREGNKTIEKHFGNKALENKTSDISSQAQNGSFTCFIC